MRVSSLLLSMLPLAFPAGPACASTIDNFLLTGEGNVIGFSLPSSPAATPSVGAGGVVAGFFITGGAPVTVDGSPGTATIEFLSGRIYTGPGLSISSNLGNFTAVGALLYSGTADSPTFNPETFSLRDFFGAGLPYTLTISPQAAATPEPAALLLLATGVGALAAGLRRHHPPPGIKV